MNQQNPVLQSVPRELTGRIRRRAWSDPRVRFWWLLAAILGVIGAGFFFFGIQARYHEAWLIRDGLHIDARVLTADGEHIKGRPERPDGVVQIEFPWNGTDHQPPARVLEGRTEFVKTWSILPIHVNPNDPDDWTWLDAPSSLLMRMIGALVVIPIALLTTLWVIYLRRKLLQTWRNGALAEALVVETRHIAVAPRCRIARVTPAEENDQRVFAIYLPPSLSGLRRGDSVSVLRPPGKAGQAVAAAWFE